MPLKDSASRRCPRERSADADRLQLQPTNVPIDMGDHLRFYYEGMKRRVPQHDIWTDGTPRDPFTLSPEEQADWLEDTHTGIYVRELRKDGFVSLDAASEGSLLTEPITVSGQQLLVNADASQGQIGVEILDVASHPIPGFAIGNGKPIEENGIALRVSWNGKDGIGALDGQSVRVRFHLTNARLYAFWTK